MAEPSRGDDLFLLELLACRDHDELSAAQIGKMMGKSRSAVLGIFHRQRDGDIVACACVKPDNKDGGMPARWWAS